jgi:putative addiction module component (TIGR02574 family)
MLPGGGMQAAKRPFSQEPERSGCPQRGAGRPADARLILMDSKGTIGSVTLRVLEKEVLELPPRSRVRLVEKIIESLDDYADPGLQAAWDEEIERRVKEIKSGAEKGIPAAQVMKEARQALNETRRLSSARRK